VAQGTFSDTTPDYAPQKDTVCLTRNISVSTPMATAVDGLREPVAMGGRFTDCQNVSITSGLAVTALTRLSYGSSALKNPFNKQSKVA
jgi:hypothetical protein